MAGDLINALELYESSNGKMRLRISSEEGIAWDLIEATYPTPTQEVYTYKLLTNVVKTITVNYTASNKKFILSVVKA